MLTRSLRAGDRMRSKAALDAIFRRKVKARDAYTCQRCGSHRDPQCAHYFPRARESTRWLMEAAITLCDACHRHFTKRSKTEWPAWLESRIGADRFEALRLLSLQVQHRPLDEVRAELSGESA